MLDMNDRNLVLCGDDQGRATTPSCVWADPKTEEIVVGHRAYARRGTAPEPMTSVKRAIGTRIDTPLGRAQRSPADISGLIRGHLRRQTESELAGRADAPELRDVEPQDGDSERSRDRC